MSGALSLSDCSVSNSKKKTHTLNMCAFLLLAAAEIAAEQMNCMQSNMIYMWSHGPSVGWSMVGGRWSVVGVTLSFRCCFRFNFLVLVFVVVLRS